MMTRLLPCFTVAVATATVDFSVPAAADPAAVSNIVTKGVSGPYRELKKHEVGAGDAPAGKQTNRQKTSERLQRMDALLNSRAPHRFQ